MSNFGGDDVALAAQRRVEALKEEHVAYDTDHDQAYPFVPHILLSLNLKEGAQQSLRPFEKEDMERVLDFDTMTSADPLPDGLLMICEPDAAGASISFPERHVLIRGGFMFVFDKEDLNDGNGPYTEYLAPPMGLIPIDDVRVDFPAGGRRVFREHAHTEANKKGYEFVILHQPPKPKDGSSHHRRHHDSDDDESQPPEEEEVEERRCFFVVAHTLGEREKWAQAIRVRSKYPSKPTKLRANYGRAATSGGTSQKPGTKATPDAARGSERRAGDASDNLQLRGKQQQQNQPPGATKSKISSILADKKKKKDEIHKKQFDSEDAMINAAIHEFAPSEFSEQAWMNEFFENHNDFDAPARCDQMEHWQAIIKKRLKTIVLEQYEYFVQASGEMTTMGREVASLRNLVETQVETVKNMKDIDFSGAIYDYAKGDNSDSEDDELYNPTNNNNGSNNNGSINKHLKGKKARSQLASGGILSVADYHSLATGLTPHNNMDDDHSEVSSMGENSMRGRNRNKMGGPAAQSNNNNMPNDMIGEMMQIPTWIKDVGEEIAACMKECRYTDAVDLWQKAKDEINELYDKHYQPIQNIYLSKRQLDTLHSIQKTLKRLNNKMGTRLEEALRRKNEALKQAYKRERSDPLAAMAPIVSPCCLEDDSISLQLLVRLNKTQIAANAYSTRRSLLLLESLHEHPISGAGSVDLVIYSAQLSQSFFSCLAISVEGFLDLFTSHAALNANQNNNNNRTNPMNARGGDTESMTSSLQSISGTKMIPAGAMASIVLWCDAELAKFATAFGGTRILANLALSPPPRNNNPNKDSSVRGPRVIGDDPNNPANGSSKERNTAIEVAAQCVDQAFSCASQNLDSVGLPLTPRLAEYLRSRLKGCEAEVAMLLDDRWSHITLDWRASAMMPNDISMMDDRIAL